ncbi:MAG: hypothetical protein ABFR36_02605 [Acidobacteriota bacterium]
MTKKILVFFTLLLLICSIGNSSDNSADKVKMYNENINNNLLSFGKDIIVNGSVERSLIKIGGSLRLNGKVNRDVVCISSKVELGEEFFIGGDLIVIGGSLVGKNQDNIKGDIHNINLSIKKIDSSLTSFALTSNTLKLIRIIFLIISLILSLIIFGLIPVKIKKAEELMTDNALRIGSLGILSLLTFIILFLLAIILSLIYIGIPLLLIILLLFICLFVFGRTVMYYSIGQWVINKFNLSIFSPAIFILIGVITYAILSFIPVAGFILLKVLAIFELGISVGYLLRKKLNLKSISEFVAEYGNE